MVKFSTVCMNCEMDKEANLNKYLKYIDEAALNGANLIVFPEQSLQGYLTSVVSMDMSGDAGKNEFLYQYKNSEVVPNGSSVQAIIKKAQEKNIYVVIGMTERDADINHKLYNTAVLVGPEGYIGKYRKVHQPADELHSYYHGDGFQVFDTSIGKIGLLICYDKWLPESTRELALMGAQILIMPTATAFSDEKRDFDNDFAYYSYDTFDRARAMENQTYFISSNQIGICGVSDYFGHSNIVSPEGRIVASTGYKEGIAYFETKNIEEDIFWGKEHFAGLNFLKDRRPSAYKMLSAESELSNNK